MSTAAVVEQIVAVATIAQPQGAAAAVAREQAPVAIVVAAQGPAGPQGPPGAVQRYVHPQTAPSALWTVTHNLGARPNVDVLTVGGLRMIAAVVHLSDNVCQVVLDDAVAGQAICI